jgi:predicted dehydrogenase
MRVVIVGLGVQGRKRLRVAGHDVVATVDPVAADATVRELTAIPTDSYDAALLCVPNQVKLGLLQYLIGHRKHALIEKPLQVESYAELVSLEQNARAAGVTLYTAYNHRFEPHIARVRRLIVEGAVGTVYRISAFYGNGTARLVRDSAWRDQGTGVLHDLGSHTVDLIAEWSKRPADDYRAVSLSTYENRAPDHAVFQAISHSPHVFGELSLLSWRNHFRADIIGDTGSLHIDGLAKWGDSHLIWRRRVFPAGRPDEESWHVPAGDPTWQLEYQHFLTLCREGVPTDLSRDIHIHEALTRVIASARRNKPENQVLR